MDALTASYRVFTCFMPVSLIKFSLISPGFRSFDITREENLRIQNSFSNDQARWNDSWERREGKWRKQYPEKFRGNTAWRKSTKPRGTTSGNLIKMVAVILVK